MREKPDRGPTQLSDPAIIDLTGLPEDWHLLPICRQSQRRLMPPSELVPLESMTSGFHKVGLKNATAIGTRLSENISKEHRCTFTQ